MAAARGAEFHQQFLARELHGGELLEPRPQPLPLPPPHRTLFGDTVDTLGKDVELAFLLQQLHLNSPASFLPGLGDQMLLQARQATLRGGGPCSGR